MGDRQKPSNGGGRVLERPDLDIPLGQDSPV
jgi:hypothetical protein